MKYFPTVVPPQTDLTSDEEQSTTIDLSDAQVAEQVNSRSGT